MTAYPRLTAALQHAFSPLGLKRRLACAALALALGGVLPGQALAVSDDAVLRHMDSVLEENARLRDEAWKARRHGHEAAKQAEAALDASNERVEKTRVEALAHVAGVSQTQVEGLRREGRSWGQAAGDLGVHPGFLGVGKAPLYDAHSAARVKDKATAAKGKRGRKGKTAKAAKVEARPTQKKTKSIGKTKTVSKSKAAGKATGKTGRQTKHKKRQN
ncbi:MAG: hypothetical protein AUJ49_08515 [Desulfovibrionaceae bacterium CG1_02_65_16]|nr:MAG: hypothetical protein AUJ49_08515 [Desulfovibrionaceae bacterium CG1_02_65_16]